MRHSELAILRAFIIVLLSLMGGPIQAGQSHDPLPIGQGLSPELVAASFEMTRVIPPGNPDYAFRLMRPVTWIEDRPDGLGQVVSDRAFVPLFAVRHPDSSQGPVIFHVQAMALTHDLRADHLWASNGHQLGQMPLARRELSPWFLDSLMRQTIAEVPVRVRQAVLLSGSRAFIVSGMAAESAFDDYAEWFGLMVASFAPESVPEHPGAEDWLTSEFGPGLHFRYPESWQMQRLPTAEGTALRLRWISADGTVVGHIGLEREARLLPDAQAFALIERLLTDAGLRLSEAHEPMRLELVDSPLRARAGRIYGVDSTDQAGRRIVRVMLFELNGESVSFWQIQPHRSANFLASAINERAMQLVLSTLTR